MRVKNLKGESEGNDERERDKICIKVNPMDNRTKCYGLC